MSALDLLRKHEPVVRYTQGEMFFPTVVDEYLRRSELWRRDDRGSKRLRRAGEVEAETLADEQRWENGRPLFLQFVDRPLSAAAYGRWRATRPAFRRQGRLARVGLAPRFIDAFFTLSLLLRGRVPGGTTAAASVKYDEMFRTNPGYYYYGRVKQQGDYTVLQYFFFYAMNDWRSSFFGVNDHEADWEQVLIYLGNDGGGEPRPLWLALAAHDYSGDDLRCRWDDPRLEVVDSTHPIVYAGAGSHAAYVEPGDYPLSFQAKPLKPIEGVFQLGHRLWRDVLKQGEARGLAEGRCYGGHPHLRVLLAGGPGSHRRHRSADLIGQRKGIAGPLTGWVVIVAGRALERMTIRRHSVTNLSSRHHAVKAGLDRLPNL